MTRTTPWVRLLCAVGLACAASSCSGAGGLLDEDPSGDGGAEAEAGSGPDDAVAGASMGEGGAGEGGASVGGVGGGSAGSTAAGMGGAGGVATGGDSAGGLGGAGGKQVVGGSGGVGGSAGGSAGAGGTGGDGAVLSCASSTMSFRSSGGLELEHELGGIDKCGGNAYEDEINVVFFLFPDPADEGRALIASFFAPVASGQTGTFTPSLVSFTGLGGAWSASDPEICTLSVTLYDTQATATSSRVTGSVSCSEPLTGAGPGPLTLELWEFSTIIRNPV